MNWIKQQNKAKTIFYWIATIILIVALVGMITDFINWKDAIGLIKKDIPVSGPNATYIGGGARYTPFRWAGPLRGRVYLTFDEDMETPRKETVEYNESGYGSFVGVLKGFSGVDFALQKISDFPTYYGKTTIKRGSDTKNLEMWVYVLNRGKKTYKTVSTGQVPVDYPITRQIIQKYKKQIDTDNNMTEKNIDWLCTFTHNSLHNYILSFFKSNKTNQLFVSPNIYAYRLDQEISSQVKWKKTYKQVWTGERKGACIGVIYKIDNKTYVRVIYNAYWIHCHGGGYIWSAWK